MDSVLYCAVEGATLQTEQDAVDMIGSAFEAGAQCVVVPVGRLGTDFFDLSTRVAGGFIQKFVTYRRRLVVLGDISDYLARSKSLRDFVYECNAGDYLWFVPDQTELDKRLAMKQ